MPSFPAPHEHIAAHSQGGSPLLLRLRSPRSSRHGYHWLRVHTSGELERGEGDERRDRVITPLLDLGPADPRISRARELQDLLFRRLHPHDLGTYPPWDKFYPVQAFTPDRTIEGYIGIEVDMGMRSDIFGLDGQHSDQVSLLDDLSALLELLS